mmetsp:Transcript_18194/g.50958  ORF Transcript_18194/g.50958 Transcript_18194/m.50958 type:complete len:210 (+) Transcript_18194:1682-2311(+)
MPFSARAEMKWSASYICAKGIVLPLSGPSAPSTSRSGSITTRPSSKARMVPDTMARRCSAMLLHTLKDKSCLLLTSNTCLLPAPPSRAIHACRPDCAPRNSSSTASAVTQPAQASRSHRSRPSTSRFPLPPLRTLDPTTCWWNLGSTLPCVLALLLLLLMSTLGDRGGERGDLASPDELLLLLSSSCCCSEAASRLMEYPLRETTLAPP